MTIPRLPIEIWELILNAVPKQYNAFIRAVCKTWRQLIEEFKDGRTYKNSKVYVKDQAMSCVRMLNSNKQGHAINIAIAQDDIPLLNELFNEGHLLVHKNLRYAAQCGSVETLEWLRNKNCPWNSHIMLTVAAQKRLTITEWFLDNNYQYDENILCKVFRGNDVEHAKGVVSLIQSRRHLFKNLCSDATTIFDIHLPTIVALYGSKSMVLCLKEFMDMNFFTNRIILKQMVGNHDVDSIEFIYSLGAPITSDVIIASIYCGNIPVIDWIATKGKLNIDRSLLCAVKNIETVIALRRNGYNANIKRLIIKCVERFVADPDNKDKIRGYLETVVAENLLTVDDIKQNRTISQRMLGHSK